MKKIPQKTIVQQKVHSQKGKWVEKPRRMAILVCSCGNKYVKSRHIQKVCVRCINDLALKSQK